MDTEAFARYIVEDVYPEMSKVSLALASMVVLTMIILTIYDKRLVDRVTLRLQTAISCYDIWAHAAPLWTRRYDYEGSSLCTFIAFQGIAFPLLYCFLNVAIGINLQLVFIHGVYITRKIEAAYWIGSILLTLVITVPFLATGLLGYSDFLKCYFVSNDENYIKTIDFYGNVLIMIICMVYLLVIVIVVIVKLCKETKTVRDFRLFRRSTASIEAVRSIKIMGFRILLYPILMLISHSGLIFNQSAFDLADLDSPEIRIYSYITGGLLGTLNFIAFCCDPSIHSAFWKIYLRYITRSGFREESIKIEANEVNFEALNSNSNSTESTNNNSTIRNDIIIEVDDVIRSL